MFFILDAVLDIALLYSTSCYNLGVARGEFGPWSSIYFISIIRKFSQFYEKVVLRLSEHGDVIETHTIKVCPPKGFQQTRSLITTIMI